jgi:hypothetical protein
LRDHREVLLALVAIERLFQGRDALVPTAGGDQDRREVGEAVDLESSVAGAGGDDHGASGDLRAVLEADDEVSRLLERKQKIGKRIVELGR